PLHLRSLLLASLAGDPDIAGAMIVVEPGRLAPDDAGFTWYVRREADGLVEQSVQDLGYDYRSMPWYVRTMASPRPWWSEPYANAATAGVDFTTYNLPLRLPGDSERMPALGMVSLDVPVSRLLQGLLLDMPDGAGLQPVLFSPEGPVVAHPDPAGRLRQRLDLLVEHGGRSDPAALGRGSRRLPVPRRRQGRRLDMPDGAGLQPGVFAPGGLGVAHPDPAVRRRQRLDVLVEHGGRSDLAPLAQAQAGQRAVEFVHH